MNTRLFSLLLAALLGLCACDTFKQADASAGLLMVPYVNAVTIDGHQYMRLVGKKSVALIDPVGGHVVEFYLQNRAKFQLFQNEEEAKKIEFPASPNVIVKSAEFRCPGSSDLITGVLDQSHYWQSEAWTVGITMLSDRDGAFGGFYRKTFELNDDGSLSVRVSQRDPLYVLQPAGIKSRTDKFGQVVRSEVEYHDKLTSWTERWTITPAAATTQPQK